MKIIPQTIHIVKTEENKTISGTLILPNSEKSKLITETIIKRIAGDYYVYDGRTSFTPSTERTTISTNNKVLTSDIVIEPIPSNYGLITFDGASLTVS